MNQLPNVLMMLAGRWGRSLAGWAIASTLIWYLFPLVPALQSPPLRIAAIAAVLAVCLAVNGGIAWRNRRRRKALAAAVTGEGGQDPREAEAEAREEVAKLRERMKQALAHLHRKGRGRRIYEQPWFVMIGPPGSGKTTALLNSGLHLPLAQDGGAQDGGAQDGGQPSLRGVGGTRLCDWWFADEAVLIDTAGRYTTQDSDAALDRAGWLGFLDLLRRTRPRQPINGVIVVLSLIDLAAAEPEERAAHARSVRLRINEITERLKLRVPVYVVLSKADQMRGFDAYFDDLDPAARAQVWGMTFPQGGTVDAFGPEFRLLLGRLEERRVERLQAERAGERRAAIDGFPLQVASLQQPLTEFLHLAFKGGKLDPAPFLRGVYMTSATQQGTPIDRLTGMLARSFGVDQMRVPSLRPVNGRSYFVTRLVREVILGEALLVSQPPARMRRRRVLRTAGFSAVGLATVAGGLLLWRAHAANAVAVEQAGESLAAYRQQLAGLSLDPVDDDDLAHVSPLLDAAAGLPNGRNAWGGDAWEARVFGLSQRAKLAQSGRLAYRRALERIFLPRLVWRLEQQMRSRFDNPDFLYQATRVYLMLGGAGPLAPDLVRSWMAADWEARLPGALNAALREHLLAHLNALLAEPLPPLTLDGALVEAARATFSRVSLAERVYSRIRANPGARAVPDWTPASALGAAGVRLFTRPSGRPLTEGIPGFFTAAGYRDILMHDLPAATRAAAEESWVLGRSDQVPTEAPQITALEDAVVSLYAAEVQKRWDALLGDLALALGGDHETTVRDLYVLSSPQSPIRDLLAAVVRELRLDAAPDAKPALAPASPAPAPPAALRAVEAHFRPLSDLVGSGGAAPLDNVLRLINALQQVLAAAAPGGAPLPSTLQGSGDPVQLLLAEAERQPVPVSGWLRQIATAGNAMLGSATRAAASAAFAGDDGPQTLCRSVVDGHFPFDAQSSADAPIDDFARLFAPGGQLDAYYQAQVKPFVDTRGAAWQPHALGGVAAPVDAAAVASFQRAAAIRDAFFPAGGGPPQLRFSLAPAPGNGNGTGDGTKLQLGATPVGKDAGQATSFTWPGADGMGAAALQFESSPGAPAALQASGPWALFRLLAQGRLSPAGGPTSFDLAFDVGDRHAAYALQAGSQRNPFSRNLLRGFRCPAVR
jgi:type VI secretion system protein ImpL